MRRWIFLGVAVATTVAGVIAAMTFVILVMQSPESIELGPIVIVTPLSEQEITPITGNRIPPSAYMLPPTCADPSGTCIDPPEIATPDKQPTSSTSPGQ